MGLSDFEQILLFLHRWFPNSFYPKCKEIQPEKTSPEVASIFLKSRRTGEDGKGKDGGGGGDRAFDPDQVIWPDALKDVTFLLDEMNGTTRSLPLGTKEERREWYEEGKRQFKGEEVLDEDAGEDEPESPAAASRSSSFFGGSSSEETDEDLKPILTPEDMLRYFFDRYSRAFYYNNVKELHVVWDCIGRTPAIKGILRTETPHKRVVWPGDRATLFTGNHRFKNSIHDFFADKEARKLLYEYLTRGILERFPTEGYLPRGCRIVVWGAVYDGKECDKPIYVDNDPLIGLTEVKVLEDPTAPCAEADVLIGYIVRKHIGHGNIMITSKDSDFIPVLLSILNSHYKTSQSPRKFRVLFSHKILVKTQISQEDHAQMQRDLAVSNTIAEAEQQQQQQQQKQQADDIEDIDDILKSLSTADSSTASVAEPSLSIKHFMAPSPKGSPAAAKRRSPGPDDMVEIKARMREVVDMNTLYEGIWAMMHSTHKGCTLCDPLDGFLALLFLAGCDYLKKLPFVSFKTLCYVYLNADTHKKVGCLCPFDGGIFRLRLSAFKNLAALSYKHFRGIKDAELKTPNAVSYEEVREALVKRKTANDAAKAKAAAKKAQTMPEQLKKTTRKAPEYLPPEFPERYAANLVWVVNYYTRSNQPGWVPSNGLEADPASGLSLYGYTKIKGAGPGGKDKYEFAEKVLTRDVL